MLRTFRLVVLALVSAPAFASEPAPPAPMLQAARLKVAKLMEAHENERTAIQRAYGRMDAAWLEQQAVRMAGHPGLALSNETWMRAEYAPFTSCDMAQRDLALLTSAMAKHAARGTPSAERLVRQELADYDKSSATCKRRLAMTPASAWAAYQAE